MWVEQKMRGGVRKGPLNLTYLPRLLCFIPNPACFPSYSSNHSNFHLHPPIYDHQITSYLSGLFSPSMLFCNLISIMCNLCTNKLNPNEDHMNEYILNNILSRFNTSPIVIKHSINFFIKLCLNQDH